MARYRVERPNQEVRLRKWEPGRVAQLKLFLGHLEQTLNNSLAAQVVQSPKRKFSEFVPIIPIQNITVDIEFREIRVSFEPPRGLRKFLVYEWQLSQFENFASFQRFTSPDPIFVFSALADGATHYIRVRVVTTNGLVGPFSETLEATTPLARSIQTFDGSLNEVRIFKTDEFTNVFTIDHESIGGTASYYTVEYQIVGNRPNGVVGWTDILFQWLVDGDQVGQDMMITAVASNNTDMIVETPDIASGPMTVFAPFNFTKRGTLVQKVSTLDEGTRTITLRAKLLRGNIHPTSGDYTFAGGSDDVKYENICLVSFRNFSLFEVIASA